MKIEYLQVTIEPWSFKTTENKVLKVKTKANGVNFNFKEILTPHNDFESLFDQMMDNARRITKKLIREHAKANPSEEMKESGEIKTANTTIRTVTNCARCHQDHKQITFKPLTHPAGEYTHYGTCSETEEPILMKLQ